MNKNNAKIPLTHKTPNLDFEREIGGTTYEVTSLFEQNAKEDMTVKVKRLILKENKEET